MFWSPKCPYCRGRNLYLKRTWPTEQYGCRDCEEKIEQLRESGLSESQIRKLFDREG